MNIKVELVALGIRYLSKKTNLIHKPDSLETFITEIFGGKSYDRRLAEDVLAETEKVCETVKRARTNRKFKKITQDF